MPQVEVSSLLNPIQNEYFFWDFIYAACQDGVTTNFIELQKIPLDFLFCTIRIIKFLLKK